MLQPQRGATDVSSMWTLMRELGVCIKMSNMPCVIVVAQRSVAAGAWRPRRRALRRSMAQKRESVALLAKSTRARASLNLATYGVAAASRRCVSRR